MTLLRLFAFRPVACAAAADAGRMPVVPPRSASPAGSVRSAASERKQTPPAVQGNANGVNGVREALPPATPAAHESAGLAAPLAAGDAPRASSPPSARGADVGGSEAPKTGVAELPDWHALVASLPVGGIVRQLAQHSELRRFDGAELVLRLAVQQKQLLMRTSQDKLQQALADHFGRAIRLAIEVGDVENQTPADSARQERQERQERAVAAVTQDEFVRAAEDLLDASLVESSIQPL